MLHTWKVVQLKYEYSFMNMNNFLTEIAIHGSITAVKLYGLVSKYSKIEVWRKTFWLRISYTCVEFWKKHDFIGLIYMNRFIPCLWLRCTKERNMLDVRIINLFTNYLIKDQKFRGKTVSSTLKLLFFTLGATGRRVWNPAV